MAAARRSIFLVLTSSATLRNNYYSRADAAAAAWIGNVGCEWSCCCCRCTAGWNHRKRPLHAHVVTSSPPESESVLSPRSPWRYSIAHVYPPMEMQSGDSSDDQESNKLLLLQNVITSVDPKSFPSKSQARKACRQGRIGIKRATDAHTSEATIGSGSLTFSEENLISLGINFASDGATAIKSGDVILIRERLPDDFYESSATGYVDPPPNIAALMPINVLFEDDDIAVVEKPEMIDTIGKKREDFQSILPFILRPPSHSEGCLRVPRPVHRLDRRTSGCVLVAKTDRAMTHYSRMFAERRIQKSYVAVVFGVPNAEAFKNEQIEVNNETYAIVDYPIDGKDAVTLWRTISTISSPDWGTLSLIHLIPKTGRMHQLRRHLSYCLQCAIVGDSKYDGGGEKAKNARKLGLFLCSNSIKFTHKFRDDDSVVQVNVSLPEKFFDIMGK